MLELTGGAPKVLFGTMDNPVCELSLDRANGRLESSCAIETGGRRLGEEATVSVAEHEKLKAEHAALKAEVAALRRAVEALEKKNGA